MAIKLIRRPIPRVVAPNILREIRVRSRGSAEGPLLVTGSCPIHVPAADPCSSGISLARACLSACTGCARVPRGTALTKTGNILLVGMFSESEHGNDRVLTGARARRAQIQADLGEGHVNVIKAKEAILTDQVLCKAPCLFFTASCLPSRVSPALRKTLRWGRVPGVEQHLALVMEYAACGSLTSYVAEQWQRAQHSGLFLSEDEARYFFRV